jgi:hypothetical protein
MEGRAAPWFASPDRADRILWMIARLLQHDKPARPARRRDPETAGAERVKQLAEPSAARYQRSSRSRNNKKPG